MSSVLPGQKPGSYLLRFRAGPWDGMTAGIDEQPPAEMCVPNYELARYELARMSGLPPDADLTDKHVARCAEYVWVAQ